MQNSYFYNSILLSLLEIFQFYDPPPKKNKQWMRVKLLFTSFASDINFGYFWHFHFRIHAEKCINCASFFIFQIFEFLLFLIFHISIFHFSFFILHYTSTSSSRIKKPEQSIFPKIQSQLSIFNERQWYNNNRIMKKVLIWSTPFLRNIFLK